MADGGHHDWASVALFYSAHQWVHSSLADERGTHKDERHPRKHVSPKGGDFRGTNQMVRQVLTPISVSYLSLFDASHRTRYDYDRLSGTLDDSAVWKLLLMQHGEVAEFCKARNATRAPVSTQALWSPK